MNDSARAPSWVAFAVTHDEPPQVFLAEDDVVLSRVPALNLVAATSADELSREDRNAIRRALQERWADAVATWIGATGIVVDAYGGERVWTDRDLDELAVTLELRVARILDDTSDA